MPDKNKHGLGRGLDALFGDDFEDINIQSLTKEQKGLVEEVDIEKLTPCPFQPRQIFDEESLNDLTQSVKQKGVLQPLLVRQKGDKFEIIAGERRFRAALKAGLTRVPVIKKSFNDAEAFEVALIENIIRQNLTPIEEANGFEKLVKDYQYTHENLSKSVGKSRSYITNAIRLLSLPLSVQNYVNDGKLSASHARTLVGLQNAESLAEKIIAKDLNVRQTEDLINKLKSGKKVKEKPIKNQDITEIEQNLERLYQAKTEVIFDHKGRGRIVFKYNNFAELEKLLNKLEK